MIFLDLETTGLDKDLDLIMELGIAVTTADLDVIDNRYWVFPMNSRHEFRLEHTDQIVVDMHTDNGLIREMQKIRALGNTLSHTSYKAIVEYEVLTWFQSLELEPGSEPMCGSGVHFDRNFIFEQMPLLHDFFHYRNIDVSTLRRCLETWAPETFARAGDLFTRTTSHRAMSDVFHDVEKASFIRGTFQMADKIWPSKSA